MRAISGGRLAGIWRQRGHGAVRGLPAKGHIGQFAVVGDIWGAQIGQGRLLLDSNLGCGRWQLARPLSLELCLFLLFPLLAFFVLNGLLHLGGHDSFQSFVDFASAVDLQGAVSLRDVMPEEGEVEDGRCNQTQGAEDPDDQGEQHAEVDDGLSLIFVPQCANVDEELLKGRVIGICSGHNVGSEHGIQCHGIDTNTRPLGENDADGGLEGKVDEEGDVVGALSALSQGIEDEEALEAASAHALHIDSQRVQKALCHASSSQDAYGSDPFIEAQGPRQANTDGEDPLAVFQVQSRLDLTAPAIKGKQIDSSEGVDSVDGNPNQSHKPEPDVC